MEEVVVVVAVEETEKEEDVVETTIEEVVAEVMVEEVVVVVVVEIGPKELTMKMDKLLLMVLKEEAIVKDTKERLVRMLTLWIESPELVVERETKTGKVEVVEAGVTSQNLLMTTQMKKRRKEEKQVLRKEKTSVTDVKNAIVERKTK